MTRAGQRIAVEIYPTTGTRTRVVLTRLDADGPAVVDSINLAAARERLRLVAQLPAAFRSGSVNLPRELLEALDRFEWEPCSPPAGVDLVAGLVDDTSSCSEIPHEPFETRPAPQEDLSAVERWR